MVLALSLPQNFPFRDLLVSMTFGVVILSILVHGLTMSPLLRWLGVVRGLSESRAYELQRAQILAGAAALGEIDRMANRHVTDPDILETLRQEYRQAVQQAQQELASLGVEHRRMHSNEVTRTRHELLSVEKKAVIDSYQQGALGRAAYEQVLANIDARLLHLESQTPSEDNPDDDSPPKS